MTDSESETPTAATTATSATTKGATATATTSTMWHTTPTMDGKKEEKLDLGDVTVVLVHSSSDKAFAHRLHDALPAGRAFESSLTEAKGGRKYFEQDVVIVVLSPDMLKDAEQNKIVDVAVEFQKRIVPVVCRDVDYREVRKDLASLNWIFFRPDGDDFEAAMKLLVKAVVSDEMHVKYHTRLSLPDFRLAKDERQKVQQWLLACAQGKRPCLSVEIFNRVVDRKILGPSLFVQQDQLFHHSSEDSSTDAHSGIFISYSRRDLAFVKNVHDALKVTSPERRIWIDWEDAPPSSDWLLEIQKGIEQADVFVCVLSPDYIKSEACNREVDHAVKNGKLIVPLVCRDVDYRGVRKEIASLNWIFFRPDGDDFEAAMKLFTKALDPSPISLVKYHTKLLIRALAWEKATNDPTLSASNYLLKGARDKLWARDWLSQCALGVKPVATPLHIAWLEASARPTLCAVM